MKKLEGDGVGERLGKGRDGVGRGGKGKGMGEDMEGMG